jgi:hypothetical protein
MVDQKEGLNGQVQEPKTDIFNPAEPKYGVFDPVGAINEKFDFYIKIVVGVLIVAMLTMLFMVGGLLLDAWHFNSTVYKEYSEKINTLNDIQKTNEELLIQNKNNQEIIIQQQNEIKNILKK